MSWSQWHEATSADQSCELLKWFCNGRKLHNTTTIFPLAPEQIIAQMWTAERCCTNCLRSSTTPTSLSWPTKWSLLVTCAWQSWLLQDRRSLLQSRQTTTSFVLYLSAVAIIVLRSCTSHLLSTVFIYKMLLLVGSHAVPHRVDCGTVFPHL